MNNINNHSLASQAVSLSKRDDFSEPIASVLLQFYNDLDSFLPAPDGGHPRGLFHTQTDFHEIEGLSQPVLRGRVELLVFLEGDRLVDECLGVGGALAGPSEFPLDPVQVEVVKLLEDDADVFGLVWKILLHASKEMFAEVSNFRVLLAARFLLETVGSGHHGFPQPAHGELPDLLNGAMELLASIDLAADSGDLAVIDDHSVGDQPEDRRIGEGIP